MQMHWVTAPNQAAGGKNVHRVQDHDKTLQLYAMIATSSTHTDVAPLTPTSHMLWHLLSG